MTGAATRLLRSALLTVAVALAILTIVDAIFYAAFPTFDRLRYNFSAAYLKRELARLRSTRPTIVLGDSTLWGFGVPSQAAAVSLVAAKTGCCVNLSYVGGSPVNSLAMLHVILAAGVRPRAVIFNVNQKQFNTADSAFRRLYPAVEQLAWPLLSQTERAWIAPSLADTADAKIDRGLATIWQLYGMRADLRDALFGDADAASALATIVRRASGAAATEAADHAPTPDKFEGTYDLQPLGRSNTSYAAVQDLATLLRQRHIPAYAILSPTNHTLLHDYIDDPAYRDNVRTVAHDLRALGVRVFDLDRAMPAADFIDNDHLTIAGNRRLADILETQIRP